MTADLHGLPELGVGFVYWPALDGLLDQDKCPIDVLEVEPQVFWLPSRSGYELDRRAFDHFQHLPQPKLAHGVGFPVGGTVADSCQVAPFIESVERLDAAWASEHLSFNRGRGEAVEFDVGFLLPPLQSPEGVSVAAANIAALAARLPVPFAFETGVNYLRPRRGELSDGEFFAAVAETADCGILLDLHNLWANERNGRQAVLDVVDELPLDRVVEVHLAGGDEYAGYWVDAHSGLIPPAVMDLARCVIPRLPNLKAIIYEVLPDYVAANGISMDRLADQLCEVRGLWELRGKDTSPPRKTRRAASACRSPVPSVREWEDALCAALSGAERPPVSALLRDINDDPGIDLLRALIGAVRAGKVTDILTLTTRLLLLSIGEQGLQKMLDAFWAGVPSEPMALDEALRFAAYATNDPSAPHVRHLREVMDFELAAHRATLTGEPTSAAFSVDPGPLLAALRAGRLPPPLTPGNYQVTVTPPDL